ncbi:SAM-dependent methyltransferase [Azospirillum sp.]|uniref:SAM-dependent methyltransferase n=1 Tax=Azospirillum sp. TaxID=34012 RepID=UPI002D51BBA2|nr:SAM-dependent methyltransferase [Azospirillum sp.]HYF90480.1 SAM-dependent methyltransferase [Azospirillum sp.]
MDDSTPQDTSASLPQPAPGETAPGAVVTPLGQTVYLAADGFLDDLVAELGEVASVDGRLVFVDGPARPAAWAQNIWYDPVRIEFASIKSGAKALRGIQRNWALWSQRNHRRAALIQENLPHVSAKPVVFPSPLPTAPLGSWTLTDESTIIAAAHCSSPFRNGEVTFVENRTAPPNRAYLKLWEALTLFGEQPGPGDRCLDLGACPGGWTWVLHELGTSVVSVDKAPLDPAIAALPRVEIRQESAFGLKPATVGPVDWLCCDVICYPTRLLRLVKEWMDSGLAKRFVCTLKFQAETDHETARAFAAIPGGRVLHLHHNKHELTWMWPAK